MLLDGTKKFTMREICAALNVPTILIDGESTSYANYAEAKKHFWQDTIFPRATWFAEILTRTLCEVYQPGTKICIDKSSIEELQQNVKENLENLQLAMRAGITLNAGLRGLKLPFKATEWGDEPMVARTLYGWEVGTETKADAMKDAGGAGSLGTNVGPGAESEKNWMHAALQEKSWEPFERIRQKIRHGIREYSREWYRDWNDDRSQPDQDLWPRIRDYITLAIETSILQIAEMMEKPWAADQVMTIHRRELGEYLAGREVATERRIRRFKNLLTDEPDPKKQEVLFKDAAELDFDSLSEIEIKVAVDTGRGWASDFFGISKPPWLEIQ
jgi:hypothetical protein